VGRDDEEEFQHSSARSLAEAWAEEAMRLHQQVSRLTAEVERLRVEKGSKEMSGKLKRLMAILAALGITAGTATTFLTNVMHTFPGNKYVVGACTLLVGAIGLLVSYHPVSIKDPNADKAVLK
jgi:protein-S-isoprenylcysteine O-methyltransferase Ste14